MPVHRKCTKRRHVVLREKRPAIAEKGAERPVHKFFGAAGEASGATKKATVVNAANRTRPVHNYFGKICAPRSLPSLTKTNAFLLS